MKFYDSIGPNPRLVRMFMAEKGIEIPRVEVDLMGGENRRSPYLDLNPSGELPALELDDGSVIAETIAICEYLEELHPDEPLIGADPAARAQTRMWIRRIEYRYNNPMTDGFRSAEGLALFKDRRHCIPAAVEDWKAMAQEGLAWIEGLIDGREFITGDAFTLADILLFTFVDFAASVGQPMDAGLPNLNAWFERVKARPSVAA